MKKYIPSVIIGLITGFVNGLFGSGGGTVLVPCMERLLGVRAQKAHATAIAVILPLSVISAVLYVNRLSVNMEQLLWVCGGGIAGGIIGSKLLGKISPKWLHIVFGGFMLVSAVRMIGVL